MQIDIESTLLDGVPDDELQDYLIWRERVKGANISDKTLLATDFLNHFNEIVMLIEMIPDMPMMLDECYLWQPKTYQEHFQDSGFSDKALAIEAYNHVPTKFRRPFEETLSQMTLIVNFTLQKIANNIAADDPEKLRFDTQTSVEMIRRIIQIANGIIHGAAHVMEQEEIDAYLSYS